MPVLIASTGSNREALNAGKTPETSPIKEESPKPKSIFFADKTNSKSPENPEATRVIIQTRPKPTKPPTTAKIVASNKN